MTSGVVSCVSVLKSRSQSCDIDRRRHSDNTIGCTDISNIAGLNWGCSSIGRCQVVWQQMQAAFPAVKCCVHKRAFANVFEAVGSSRQLPNASVSAAAMRACCLSTKENMEANASFQEAVNYAQAYEGKIILQV